MNNIKRSLTFLLILIFISCDLKESKVKVFKPDASIGKDAAISEGNEKANFSTLDRIHMLSLSSNDSVKNDVRSLLRFGFTTLKEGIKIDSAFIFLQAIEPGHFGKKNSFTLLPVESLWINSEVNWKNQPSVDENNTIILEAPKEALQDYRINVTELISAIYRNEKPNYGFMLKLENEKNSYKGLRFHSSDSRELDKHPRLEVFYHE